jgi:3-phenylpropionate/trans-cinnamate dioxygenase ferredoxin subunit
MTDGFERVMGLSEIPAGSMRDCTVEGRELVVGRTKDGMLFALDNICTHAYARMCEGRLRGTRLICPLHGASFAVRDGRALGAPASKPLASHEVRAQGDDVEVRLAPVAANAAG